MSLQEHVSAIQGDEGHDPGCVTKCIGARFSLSHHGSYRGNGYKEITGDPKKKARYELSDLLSQRSRTLGALVPEQQIGRRLGIHRTPTSPETDPAAWNFVRYNFKTANRPYVHNYHHMIPWDVVSNTMSAKEAKLLQKVGYNLNAGINMIILPCFEQVAHILGMYTHPNNHPTYNEDLSAIVNKVKMEMANDDEGHLGEEEIKQLKTVLESWEKKEFWVIADAGWSAVARHVDSHSPSAMSIVSQSLNT